MVNFDGHFDGPSFVRSDAVRRSLRLDNMKLKLWTSVFCVLLHIGNCIKIYEWQRDWGQCVFTRELAQVVPEAQQIIHSATDKSYQYSVPTISLSLYNVTSEQFSNGVLVIRPLLTEGHQVCFIGQLSGQWSTDYNIVHNRQGATIAADFPPEVYDIEVTFPDDFDPLKVASITDFCEVDRDHVFYLNPTTNVSNDSTVLDIQGLFGGYVVVVTEDLQHVVLETCYKHHPNPSQEFSDGKIVVFKAKHMFSAMAIDQALEENADIKGKRDAVCVTENPSALLDFVFNKNLNQLTKTSGNKF